MALADTGFAAIGFVPPALEFLTWYVVHKTIFSLPAVPKEKRMKISLSLLFVLLAWLALANILGSANFFFANSFLVPLVAFGIPYIFAKTISGSQIYSKIADALPNHFIIGIQLFRLLGIIFLWMYAAGSLPAAFALPAGYGDILIGLTAPIVAYLYFKKISQAKKLATLWNYVGILDLVIAMIMGPITAPTLVQLLSFDAPNAAIISYPLVTVPTFAVPFSFVLHLVSLRILRKENSKK